MTHLGNVDVVVTVVCFCSGSNNATKTKTMPVLFRFCAQPDDNMQQHNMKHDTPVVIYLSWERIKCLPATVSNSSLTCMACWPVGKQIYLPSSPAIRSATFRMANPAACREIPIESPTFTWRDAADIPTVSATAVMHNLALSLMLPHPQ